MLKSIVCSVFLTIAYVPAAGADTIYKWMDSAGVSHYGNILPAKYAGVAVATMDKNGVVINQTKAALTGTQLVEEQQQAAQLDKQKQAEAEQKRKDIALLNTYSSDNDIEAARHDSLRQIQSVIAGLKLQRDLVANTSKALTPDDTARIKDLQAQIDAQTQDYDKVNKDFDAAKLRFDQLSKTTAQSRVVQ